MSTSHNEISYEVLLTEFLGVAVVMWVEVWKRFMLHGRILNCDPSAGQINIEKDGNHNGPFDFSNCHYFYSLAEYRLALTWHGIESI